MNHQEVYNKVKTHLLTQNEKSKVHTSGMCRYRTGTELKCAVGILIPDELYDPIFEGKRAYALPKFILDVIGVENDQDAEFLNILQSIHDISDVCKWEEKLEEFAINHELIP